MANLLAVSITLDVSSDDNVRIRQFTLKPSSQAIRVGRSSRNDENFMPAVQNAWFESRVISRNHATIRAVPDEQVSQLSASTLQLAKEA